MAESKIMALEIKEICGYLRDVLTFRNYIEIPDNRDSYFTISDKELLTGVLNKNVDREKLVEEWSKKGKRDELSADVLLVLKVVSDIVPKYESPKVKRVNQIWEYKRVSLLYVKAQIDRETFQLRNIIGESLVWADPLIRQYGNKYMILFHRLKNKIFGKYCEDANARFCLKEGTPIICEDGCWRQYIEEVDRHFAKRTGKGLFNSFTLTDDQGASHNLYEDDANQIIVMKDDTVFAATHIASLLNVMQNEPDARFPLFKNIVLGDGARKRLNEHKVGENVGRHLGQMKNDFSLADAQRDVVHCFSYMDAGDVLAVSGPPGTGKTTMLQSIVADMVVRYVTEFGMSNAGDSAPLILASSSNNKAITNIIDAFGSGDERTSDTDLHRRWICYDTGSGERFVPMAVFCPSASVDKKKLRKYFLTDTTGGLNYGGLRNRYYNDSSDFYARAGSSLNIEASDIGTVIGEIKHRIKALVHELAEIDRTLKNHRTSCESIQEIGEIVPAGTVHTFQGAESPIVIFSLVYGKADKPVFIINNHELMNVAVSRAKDHFMIFGHRECLKNNLSDRACQLLFHKSSPIV